MKAAKWRLIDTETGSVQWNMAVDEALLEGFGEGDLPILRLYGWEPGLSLGRFSRMEKSVDVTKLEKAGLPYVRRMTGGGVLVHGGDLSYALILPRDLLEAGGVKAGYRDLCRFLIDLYAGLGQRACFASELNREGERSEVCLAGNEAYDILIDGKKMGGNAQRHTRHLLFQHGSVPIRLDEPLFTPLFLGEAGLKEAASLQRLGHEMRYETLAGMLCSAFSSAFDVQLVPEGLRASEMQRARELLVSKYTQERWNRYGKQDRS